MMNRLKTVKASMIISILLTSMIISIAPSSFAQEDQGGLFRFVPYIDMNVDNIEDTRGILPEDPRGATIIKVDVFYQIQGILAKNCEKLAETYSVQTQINVELGEVPSYCSVSLIDQSTQAYIMSSYEKAVKQIRLAVKFLKDAPNNVDVRIPLTFTSTAVNVLLYQVESETTTKHVIVSPSYIPIIDAYATKELKEVTPGEIAVFDVELVNQGNELTEFRFTDIDAPDGWTAAIRSETKVESATALDGESSKIVQLQVTPPYNFGYHDEQEQITITVQGFYFAKGNENTTSDPIPIRVIVRNRGFSFQPGIEMAAIVILIVVLLVLVFIFRTRIHIRKK